MRRFKTVTVAGISLLGVILLAGTAFSQTSAASEVRGIDPTPIIVALINLVFPAVAAVARLTSLTRTLRTNNWQLSFRMLCRMLLARCSRTRLPGGRGKPG